MSVVPTRTNETMSPAKTWSNERPGMSATGDVLMVVSPSPSCE